jgi:hypothetical protein
MYWLHGKREFKQVISIINISRSWNIIMRTAL